MARVYGKDKQIGGGFRRFDFPQFDDLTNKEILNFRIITNCPNIKTLSNHTQSPPYYQTVVGKSQKI